MLKKIICAAASLLLLSVTVLASSAKAEISVGKEFEVYQKGENAEKAAEIVGLDKDRLEGYCTENGIIYFAVNSDNTKQIRISVGVSEFSESVINLSNLSDDKITALMTDITGSRKIRGDIVEREGQKFVKTQISTSDSGGEYTVIQYITVAAKKDYVLSFYTADSEDTDYTETLFKTYKSDDFNSNKSENNSYGYIILGAVILLCLVSAYIIFTLIRDIKNERSETENDDE